jgi:hypothetical protein
MDPEPKRVEQKGRLLQRTAPCRPPPVWQPARSRPGEASRPPSALSVPRPARYPAHVQRAALVWLVVACASRTTPSKPPAAATPRTPSHAATPPPGPPLASPGEHTQYKLSLQGVELATYDFAVGAVTALGGKQAVVVQGHAKVNGLAALLTQIDDRFTSWVDVATGRPLRFQVAEYAPRSKTDIEHVETDFMARTGDTIPVSFRLNDGAPTLEPQRTTQQDVWCPNSFLLALRAWEGPGGTAQTVEVFRSRFLWHVEVKIHGKETHVTELGDLPALRIEGRAYKLDRKGERDRASSERRFTIWISDDDGRVPLEIRAATDYGDLRMQIIDYQPGSGRRVGAPS